MLVIAVLTGCDRSPQLWPAAGRVQFADGQPVTQGIIETHPDTTGGSARGKINSDGTFALSTGGRPGAVAGRHRAVVLQLQSTSAPEQHLSHGTSRRRVAAKHASYSTSELTFEVSTDAGSITHEIVLTVSSE
jgi:hypothetical protein